MLTAESSIAATSHHRIRVHPSAAVSVETAAPAVISVRATATATIAAATAGELLVLRSEAAILDVGFGTSRGAAVVLAVAKSVGLPGLPGLPRLSRGAGCGVIRAGLRLSTAVHVGVDVSSGIVGSIVGSGDLGVDFHNVIRRLLRRARRYGSWCRCGSERSRWARVGGALRVELVGDGLRGTAFLHVDIEDPTISLLVVKHCDDVVGAASLGKDHFNDDGGIRGDELASQHCTTDGSHDALNVCSCCSRCKVARDNAIRTCSTTNIDLGSIESRTLLSISLRFLLLELLSYILRHSCS